MFNQRCQNGCMCNNGYTPNCPEPIMAPKKVCMTQSCRYVEQPVICPIECQHVENIVYVPKYYPKYEQSYIVQDPCNNGAGMNYQDFNGNCGCK